MFSELRASWPALIVLLVLLLLPLGRASEAPLLIGALAGLVFAWRERHSLRADVRVRLALTLFGCYWLAALISAVDATAPEKSWETVAGIPRFAAFALFACFALRDATQWPRVSLAVAAIVSLWLLDAWMQALTGFSLGGPADHERLSGVFGGGNLKLGPVLAVLAPFVLAGARERLGRAGLLLAFALLLGPLLLAGSRASWLMFVLVAGAFAWRETRAPLRFLAWGSAGICVVALAVLIAWRDSSAFEARLQRTLLALQGSEQALDDASAGRMRIWGTALRMIAAHPINGVGVRGFRYAYAAYAGPRDAFVDRSTLAGAAHAHQLVLEVLSETGGIGLMFWIAGALLAVRAWRRASAAARSRAFAPGLALAAMCFPLNTHLAFYSAWWGLLFWWLLALYCAALDTGCEDPAHAA